MRDLVSTIAKRLARRADMPIPKNNPETRNPNDKKRHHRSNRKTDLRNLSQATGVCVFVEEDLVGHLLPNLSLGPLLLT